MKDACSTVQELKDTGKNSKEVKDAGSTVQELKGTGEESKEVKDAGGTGGADERAIGGVVKQLDARTIAHTKVPPIGSTSDVGD